MLRNQCSCYILLKRRTDGEANGSRQILKIARAIQYILFKKTAYIFYLNRIYKWSYFHTTRSILE